MTKIPDKMFFRIGDVSRITGVKSYVLRYWESEFKALRPVKNRAGQRVYRKKDVKLVLDIKKLLYDEKFTIAGAKRRIDETRRSKPEAVEPERQASAAELTAVLKKVHKELAVLSEMLK
jgi:DNA-binding transcriptional MerR regulator